MSYYYNNETAPYQSVPFVTYQSWCDTTSSTSTFNSTSFVKDEMSPEQLVPNAYSDPSYGVPHYQSNYMAHRIVSPELPTHTINDLSAFRRTLSMRYDEMQNSNFYGPIDATKPTSFDANMRPMQTPLVEPLKGYAPCEGPRPWNFAQCYGFYGEPACPLVNIVDIEDFMWVQVFVSHTQMDSADVVVVLSLFFFCFFGTPFARLINKKYVASANSFTKNEWEFFSPKKINREINNKSKNNDATINRKETAFL